jgi:capsular exopolysaccharide synthesis family protein
MENTNNKPWIVSREEKVDIQAIVACLLQRWYLFIIFGLAGLAGGILYVRYSTGSYQVKATLFVPRLATGIEAGFEGLLPGELIENQSEVYNQMEILKSYYLHEETARRLNWSTSWFHKDGFTLHNLLQRKDMFHWVSYYQDEPFRVEELEGKGNPTGIRLYVQLLDKSQYRVSASFETKKQEKILKVHMDTIGTFGRPFHNEYFHFILSPAVATLPKEQCQYSFVFNNLSQIAGYYRSGLSVSLNDKESDIICLQLSGKNPRREMDYLNALINVYIDNKISYQTATHQQSLRFIQQQLSGMSDSLLVASSSFTRFRSRNQLINVSKQGSQVMSMLQELETQKNQNQLQLDYFAHQKQSLSRSSDMEAPLSPSVVGVQDATFNRTVVRLGELISRRQVISFSANANNPTLVMLNQEIDQLNATLKENLDNLMHNARVQQNTLERQYQGVMAQLNDLPGKEQQLINYKRHFELTNATYTYLLHRRAEIEIALAGATSDVRIIDAACQATTNLTGLPARYKLMMGLLSGLAFPGILLLGSFFMSNTIIRQEDILEHTQLPVLGNIIHSHLASDTPVKDYPQSAIAESYRNIRTALQFMLAQGQGQVIAIHSIHPGEGKSFTSVNLASVFALNSKRVVLVGCDMRKPRLHRMFNCSNEHGLSTYLSGQDRMEECILPTGMDHLWLLPSGPFPPNPTELLDHPRLAMLINYLSAHYDYVLLDNSPLSMVSDALVTARWAMLNVFILRYGISKKEQLKTINEMADYRRMANVALLVNDISGAGFGSAANNYYNKYHHYGQGYYQEPTEAVSGFKKILIKKKSPYKGHHPMVG